MATTNPRLSRFPTTTRNYTQEGRALTAATGPRVAPSQAPATLTRGSFTPSRTFEPTPARLQQSRIRPTATGRAPEQLQPFVPRPEAGPPTGAQWSGTGTRTRAAAQGGTYYDPTSAWQTSLAGVLDLSAKRAARERAADVRLDLYEQSAERARRDAEREQRNWEEQQRQNRIDQAAKADWEAERSRGTPTGRTEYQEGADDFGQSSADYQQTSGLGAVDPEMDSLDYGTGGAALRAAGPAPSGPLTGPFRPTMAPSPQQDFMSAYSAARRRAASEQGQMRDMESGGFREAGPKQAEAGGEQQPIITAEDLLPPEERGPVGEVTSQATEMYGDVGAAEEGGRGRRGSPSDFIRQAGGDPDLMAFYASLYSQGVEIDSDGDMTYNGRPIGNMNDDPATWTGIAGREYGRFLDRQRQKESDQFIAEERARALPEVERVNVDPLIAAQQEKRALDQARAMRSMLAAGGASRLSPAAMVGTTAQMQQQSNIEGQAVDAAMRWQAEVQNNQNAMAAWSAEVNRLNALLQVEADMRTRTFLAEEARRAQANQRAHEMELARLQNEVTGSDILGIGLQLVATLGGAALGGIGGAFGAKAAASWLADNV